MRDMWDRFISEFIFSCMLSFSFLNYETRIYHQKNQLRSSLGTDHLTFLGEAVFTSEPEISSYATKMMIFLHEKSRYFLQILPNIFCRVRQGRIYASLGKTRII